MNNFNFLFYSNPHPMWIYDTATLKIIEVNDAAIKWYGFTKDEFLAKTIIALRPPEDIIELEKLLPELQDRNSLHPKEFRHLAKDNTIMYVEIISYHLIYNGIKARLVHAQNIDYKKAIKNKLQITQQNLTQILDNTTIGFLQVDPSFNITYWNKAAEAQVVNSMEHVLSGNFWDIFPEAIDSDFYTFLQKAMKERTSVEFTEYFWPVQKWFSVTAYPVDDGLTIHFRDITNKKLAEEKLVEKIEQLKEISYLNSHFIRKPIATLLGLSTLIKDNIAEPKEYKEISEFIYTCSLELDEAVNKLNEKVNDEDNYMASSLKMKDFGFNDLLEEIKAKAQVQNRRHKIILDNTQEVTFCGNKQRIQIAIEHLIGNAVKFSPDDTPIILTTSLVEQNLIFSVQDFGQGMDTRMLNKLCLSLAKKESTRGMGTGLFKVSEIVKKYNGSIWVESTEGKGSTFSIRFPLSNISAFKTTGKPTSAVDKDHGLEIEYDAATHILFIDWKGFQNFQTVKRGCLDILDLLKKHQYHMILNDNSNVMGTWEDATEWVGKEWFPLAEEAGLKYLAWIYSPSTFSRLSADHTIERIKGPITIKTFDKKAEGLEWLKEIDSYNQILK